MTDLTLEKTEGLGAVLDVLEQFVPLLALGPGFTEAFVGDLAGRLEAIEAAPGPAPQGFAEICDRAASTVERLGHAVPAQRIRALGAIARREVAEAGRPAEAPTAPLEDDIGWIDAVANARGAVASLAQWQGFDTSAARRERAELAVQCLADTAQALRDNPQPARTVGLANLVLDVLRLAQANTCPDLVPRIAHTVRDFVPPDEDPPARLERARRLLDGGETDQATRLLLWDLAASLSTPQGRALLARATGGFEDTRAAGVRIWQAHAANAAGDFEAMGRALTDAIRLLDDAPPGPRRTELMRVAHNIDRWVLARRAQASGGSGPQFSWAVACHDRQRGASWLARLNRGQAALAAAKAALALGHHDTGVRWAERARSAVDGLVPARQEAGYRGAFLRACVDTRFEADLTRGQALLDMGQVAQARALAQGLLTDVGQLPSTDPAMRLQATRMFLANCRAVAARHQPAAAATQATADIAAAIEGLPAGIRAIARAFVAAAGVEVGAVDPSSTPRRTVDELLAAERKWQALDESDAREERALAGYMSGAVGREAFLIGAHDLAVRCLQRAVASAEVRGEPVEARTHTEWLAEAERARGRLGVATFYAARAVAALEASRDRLVAVDSNWAEGFVDRNRSAYALLADLLLSRGRILDAERVLGRLKASEVQAYTRDLEPARPLALGPDAARRMARYDAAVEALQGAERQHESALARWRADLGLIERQAAEAAAAEVARQRTVFAVERDLLEAEIAAAAVEPAAVAHDLDGALDGLIGQDDVAVLQYLVTPRRLHLITRIGGAEPSHWVDERTDDAPDWPVALSQRIVELRAAIIDRRDLASSLAARRLAADLLPEPVRRAIARRPASTVLFALDGPLRYLPVAALPHPDDGRCLIEHWPIAHYTPAARTALDRQPVARWAAAAFGVTRAHGDFRSLPQVDDELAAVAAALPGSTTALDDAFTEAALIDGLASGRPIVHCATHFTLDPQRHDGSGLLLGDGRLLTLQAINDDPQQRYRFAHVDLLTLSACQTAFGADAGDGREVESVGVIAQRRGAQSVLASLWKVSDAGTAALMQAFYAGLAGGLTKAEALRQAQLKMMRGDAPTDGSTRASDSFDLFSGAVRPTSAAPWYWAPFVLMGHWR